MKNFIENGTTIDYTVSGEAVKSGQIVVIEKIVGVALTDGEVGETIALRTEGVYALPKATGVINQGAAVYFDNSAKNITTTDTGNTLVGVAWAKAESASATVAVKINSGFATAAAVLSVQSDMPESTIEQDATEQAVTSAKKK